MRFDSINRFQDGVKRKQNIFFKFSSVQDVCYELQPVSQNFQQQQKNIYGLDSCILRLANICKTKMTMVAVVCYFQTMYSKCDIFITEVPIWDSVN